MKTFMPLVLALAVGAVPAFAKSAPVKKAQLERSDVDFFNKAATANLAEQQLGRLAETRGHSDRVKEYGRHMVEDHGTAQQELQALARDKGVVLPKAPTAEQRALYTRLAKLRGAQFDTAFMKAMEDEHRKAIDLFEKASDHLHDGDLKSFATRTLPTLREHLAMAQEIESSLHATSGTRK